MCFAIAARPTCGLVAFYLEHTVGADWSVNALTQFKVGDFVVHSAYGLGRVVTLQKKQLSEGEAKLYYEVATQKNNVWVPVNATTTGTLRALTTKADLNSCKEILKAKPQAFNPDRRVRQTQINERLKGGSFQTICEVVRDLTALGWRKPLGEADSALLRRATDTLCQEWAAAADTSMMAAQQQISALIAESKQAYLSQ
jgi:RNA polymerase-interacting CarD/CdnL/TRCF family regulator